MLNEYVLSVLGFKYPTVYQGWLTLVGSFTLFCLRPNIPKTETEPRAPVSIFKTLPAQCLFVATIVTGSKALAAAPLGVFLAAHNVPTLCSVLCWTKHLPKMEFVVALTGLLSTFILLLHIDTVLGGEDQAWLLGHIITLSATDVFHETFDCQHKQVTFLYYKNLFSFIVLAPSSLYLGEAFIALDFKYLRQAGFYSCCIIAGVAGAVQQLAALKLRSRNNFHSLVALLKPAAVLISLPLFADEIPEALWYLITVNILSTIIVTYMSANEDRKYTEIPLTPSTV